MLITKRGTNLVLVKQVDHGELAGRIAEAWGNDQFEPPAHRDSACLAAARHDEGWRSWDDRPAMNESEHRPLHFLEIDMKDHIPLYRSGVESVAELDPYAGVLVGMHWTGLYRGRWGLQSSPAGLLEADRTPIQKLQDEVVLQEQKRWIGVKDTLWDGHGSRSDFEARLWRDYDRLQAWDMLSLFICMSVVDVVDSEAEPVLLTSTLKRLDQEAGSRVIPNVPTAPGRPPVDLVLRPVEPGVVAVNPYPFGGSRHGFGVAAMLIPDRAYSRNEISEVMRTAHRVEIECQMCPGESASVMRSTAARTS